MAAQSTPVGPVSRSVPRRTSTWVNSGCEGQFGSYTECGPSLFQLWAPSLAPLHSNAVSGADGRGGWRGGIRSGEMISSLTQTNI